MYSKCRSCMYRTFAKQWVGAGCIDGECISNNMSHFRGMSSLERRETIPQEVRSKADMFDRVLLMEMDTILKDRQDVR